MKTKNFPWRKSWNDDWHQLNEIFTTPVFGNPSTRNLRKMWEEKLIQYGWAEGPVIPDTLMRISYLKPPFGLCVQTGNVCRVHSDILKLEAMFNYGMLSAGFIAVPDDEWAKELGSNHASFSKTDRDLFSLRSAITVPLRLIIINTK